MTLMGEEEEEAAAAQAAVLTIVPVFCAMGLLGILVCNLLKKKGYHCTASKDPQPGGTGEPRLCRRHLAVIPTSRSPSLSPSPCLLVLVVPGRLAPPWGALSPIAESPPNFYLQLPAPSTSWRTPTRTPSGCWCG